MTPEKFIEITKEYWIGWFEIALDDDMSDAMWWAMMEDGFRVGMKGCCEVFKLKKPSGDTNDLVHAYLAAVGEEQS